MRRVGHQIFALLLLAGFLSVAGCGNGLAKVSGTVSIDGKPVKGGPQMSALVNFVQENGRGTSSVGTIDESGHYTLRKGSQEGIEPGSYLVSISVQKVTPPATREGLPQATLLSPAKYADITKSGLRKEVQPGSNTLDFDLSSAGGK
jgi:hypothetical protein